MKRRALLTPSGILSLFLVLASCNGNPTTSNSSDGSSTSSSGDSSSIIDDEEMKKLVLNVTIPEALNDGEFITIGSSLNDWQPSNRDYTATKVDDLHYSLSLEIATSELPLTIEYKWTKQLESFTTEDQWKGVEKAADGISEIENRVITISEDDPETITFNDTVLTFADPYAETVHTVVGNLDIIEDFAMPEFSDGRTRTIRVWTPSNYDPNDSAKRYPVIYMQDGQNLFDSVTSFAGEWGIDETMEEYLAAQKETAIVVGIDNSAHRMDEYTPNWSDTPNAEGDLYLQFIVETLKPYIDEHYNTLSDRSNTMIVGSSMGGLISFYGGLKYQDVFGKVGAFSSSFQINTQEARLEFLTSIDYKNAPRMFMSVGQNEPLLPYLDLVASELAEAGFPISNLYTFLDEDGGHNETSWRHTFPTAFEWLISEEEGNYDPEAATVNITVNLTEEAASYLESLEVAGELYLYNGQLATSPKLTKINNTTYQTSVSARLNSSLSYYVLFYQEGVIELFALDEEGNELKVDYNVTNETGELTIDVASFPIVEKLDYTINVPSNLQDYFDYFNSETAEFLLYTSSLANSIRPQKVDETTYKVVAFYEPNSTIQFQFLYFDRASGIEAYEIAEDGSLHDVVHEIQLGDSGVTTLSYDFHGFQLPVDVTVEVTLQDDFEIPSDKEFLLGLYDTGAVWGGSYRDSPMELKEGRTYAITRQAYSGTIAFIVGYCTGPLGGGYDNQVFENTMVERECKIPFSEFDSEDIPSFLIEYTTQEF